MLEWHRLRWRIEDWFRLLKTGCWVEALQRAVTLRAGVLGWAIGRTHPLGTRHPGTAHRDDAHRAAGT